MKRVFYILVPLLLILTIIILTRTSNSNNTCRVGGFAGINECEGCTGTLTLIDKEGFPDGFETYTCNGKLTK